MNTPRKPRLLITGLCPDRINTNTRIRDAIIDGAVETDLFREVVGASIEVVLAYGLLQFDYVLAVGGGASDTVQFELLRKRCKAFGALVVFWTHEDPYEFDLNCRILPMSDYFFTNERAALPFYNDNKVAWLPLAADKKYWREIMPLQDRSIDLFFCGYGYPLRIHIIKSISLALCDEFIMAVYGPNLKQAFPTLADDRSLSTDEMADIARRSVLTLNIGRDLGIANSRFGIVGETPGPRTFDVALAGAPQILFDDGVSIGDFYDQTEILTFDHPEEIASQITRLRSDDQAFNKLATAAQKKTRDNHMYRHRIESLVAILK